MNLADVKRCIQCTDSIAAVKFTAVLGTPVGSVTVWLPVCLHLAHLAQTCQKGATPLKNRFATAGGVRARGGAEGSAPGGVAVGGKVSS